MRAPGSIDSEAASWFMRRQSGLSSEEEAQFRAWIAADPLHWRAWSEVERVWSVVAYPGQSGCAGEALRELRARHRRRTRLVRCAAAAVAVAAVAALLVTWVPRTSSNLPSAAAVGPQMAVRPDIQTMPDGSTAELNDGARIAVQFTPDRRNVTLLRGEALFSVAKNPARPFIVTAGGVQVRAVGTAFSVRYEPRAVEVLVTEGRVTVGAAEVRASAGPHGHVVAAGQCAIVPLTGLTSEGLAGAKVEAMTERQMAAALSWRGQRIEFSRANLAEVVDFFNRQGRPRLVLGDAAVGRLRISGILWANNPDDFVRLMESGLNVRAERAGGVVTLRSR